MAYRSTMPNRPWLTGATYDKYDTRDTLHFDLFAYEDINGVTYFDVQALERGKTPIARTVVRYIHEFDVWTEIDALPLGIIKLYWRRATHDRFKRVHGRLLAMCQTGHGYTSARVLAHYVKPYDADPWPRNTVNTYRAPQYGEGKRPGRPRVQKQVDVPDIL